MEKSMKGTRFQKASPLCVQSELPLLGLAQLTSSSQSLPVMAAVSKQNHLRSSQKCGTIGSRLGLLLQQDRERAGAELLGQGTLTLCVTATQWEGWELIFLPQGHFPH